ncbi:MAG TPA: amidohydrolase [Bryobacteraceae bacterium]|nr:amidohydrolase [Bryobacteraceae bacterium]
MRRILKLRWLLAAGVLVPILGFQPPRRVDLIVRGGTVVTMNSDHNIIPDGLIAVTDGRILDIGAEASLSQRYTADKVIDAASRVVMPGLINLHTHSSMILFRGLADDYSLATWGEALAPLHRQFDEAPGFQEAADRLACLEMLKAGTTTFVEMYHHPDIVAGVAAQAGLRAMVTLRLPFDRDGFDKAKAEAEFDKLYRAWNGKSLITVGLAAHAPYTVPTDVLRFTAELANRRDVPLVIHLAEGPEESERIRAQFGMSPTEYLDSLQFLSPRVLAIHTIRLSDSDIGILKKRGVSVAHNPESNAKLGSGVARVPDLLRAGIHVGLGTDSAVSNNDLDLFQEMDSAVKLQRAVRQDYRALNARQVLDMVTREGAAAIHMEREIGSLEVGKRADLIVIGLDQAELQPVYNYESQLVYMVKGRDVETSIVNGRVLMENRRVLTMDESAIRKETESFRQRILKSLRKN